MTIPTLPGEGSEDWYAHYVALDGAAREVADKLDTATAAGTYVPMQGTAFGFVLAPAPSGDTTGLTDEAAIQALLDSVGAAGGGTVRLRAAPSSAPYYTRKWRLPSRTGLVGGSRHGCVVAAPLGQAAGRAIIAPFDLATSYGYFVKSLTINGRNGLEGAPRAQVNDFDGIRIESSAPGTTMFGTFGLDNQPCLEDVMVVQCSQYGVFVSGRVAEARIRNVYSFNNGVAGFAGNASDIFWDSCTAGGNGCEGFLFGLSLATGANQLVNCKAFFNGNRDTSRGDGFRLGTLTRGFTFDNCMAQDNQHDGWSIAGESHRVRGTAAGNSHSHVAIRGATDCDVDITMTPNANLDPAATYALDWSGTNVGNDVRLRGKDAFTTAFAVADMSGNTCRVRNLEVPSSDDIISTLPNALGITGQTQFASDCYFIRTNHRVARTITKIGLQVGVSSGNICVAVYRNSGSGRAATPTTRLATSGSVACPAAGYAEISLGGPVLVQPGDWLSLTVDNATATIVRSSSGGTGTAINQGLSGTQSGGAFPCPSPAGTILWGSYRLPLLVGVE